MGYLDVMSCEQCPSMKSCKLHDFETCQSHVGKDKILQQKREGEEYRIFNNANVVCSKSLLGFDEMVYYPRGFYYPVEIGNIKGDHSRIFQPDVEFGGIRQIRPATLETLFRNQRKGARRAKNVIYGYGLSNIWEQFITLTFAPKSDKNPNGINRYDPFEAKEKFDLFYRHCKRIYPDCKILAVWEYHKKADEYGARALHFHMLASGLNFPLRPYTDKDGKLLYSKAGNPLFMLTEKDWPFGLTTLALLPLDGRDNIRVVNYMIKYCTKFYSTDESGKKCKHEETDTYGAHRYFHSRNLESFQREILDLPEDDIYRIAAENGYTVYKAKEHIVVFRKPDVPIGEE